MIIHRFYIFYIIFLYLSQNGVEQGRFDLFENYSPNLINLNSKKTVTLICEKNVLCTLKTLEKYILLATPKFRQSHLPPYFISNMKM